MNNSSRTPVKFRRESTQRAPRPAPRRLTTRAAVIRAALQEA